MENRRLFKGRDRKDSYVDESKEWTIFRERASKYIEEFLATASRQTAEEMKVSPDVLRWDYAFERVHNYIEGIYFSHPNDSNRNLKSIKDAWGNAHEPIECPLYQYVQSTDKKKFFTEIKKNPLLIYDECFQRIFVEAMESGDKIFFKLFSEAISSYIHSSAPNKNRELENKNNLDNLLTFLRKLDYIGAAPISELHDEAIKKAHGILTQILDQNGSSILPGLTYRTKSEFKKLCIRWFKKKERGATPRLLS